MRYFSSLLDLMVTDERRGGSMLGTVQYRAPVGEQGTYVEAMAGNARSDRDLANTPVRSEQRGTNATLALGHPVQRDLHGYTYVFGAIEHANATSRLGAQEPRSRATVARLYGVRGHTNEAGHLMQTSVVLSAGTRANTPVGQSDDGRKHFGHLRGGLGLSGPWSTGENQ